MRNQRWESTLASYLEQSSKIAFQWGVNDCALWVARYYDQLTGSTLSDEWAGLYDTEEGADQLLQERGYKSVTDIVDVFLPSKSLKFAQRGDIVAFNGALGICDGRRSYILTKERGMFPILTSNCQRIWTV